MSVKAFIRDVVMGVPNVLDGASSSHHDGFEQAAQELGLVITRLPGRRLRLIKDGYRPIGSMNQQLTSLTSWSAAAICHNKQETLVRLARAGVPTPLSSAFNAIHGYDRALAHFRSMAADGHRLVIKPVNGRGGGGITVGLTTEKKFPQAWTAALNNMNGRRGAAVLIEQYLPGLDLRAIVVNGRFVCAATRIPAYVIGDGRSPVRELIAVKNASRSQKNYYRNYPIVADDSTNSEEVPARGEVFVVNPRCNVHQGGEAVDLTDEVSGQIKTVAERAALAIPGLGVAGVDLVVDPDLNNGKVIEVNAHCNFRIHYYPYFGQSRNPAHTILAEMRALQDSPLRIVGNLTGQWIVFRVVRKVSSLM